MKKLLPISLPIALLLWVCALGVFHSGCSAGPATPTDEQIAADKEAADREYAAYLASLFYAVPFDNHLWVVYTGSRSHSFQHHPDCYCRVLGRSEGVK